MASLDLKSLYTLTNAYTLTSLELASSNNQVVMESPKNDPSHRWYVAATTVPSYYRLHTEASGDDYWLDVNNTDGLNSINLYISGPGTTPGQLWRIDTWGDGTFRLSNNFTGLDMHLDIYSDTHVPHLASGEYSGQHWLFNKVSSSSSASPIVSTSSPSSTIPGPTSSSTSSTADSAHSKPLSTGAIVGIVIGGLLVLTVCICAIIFALRFKRSKRTTASATPVTDHNLEGNAEEKKSNVTYGERGTFQGWGNQPHVQLGSAELTGSEVRAPVEMPNSR